VFIYFHPDFLQLRSHFSNITGALLVDVFRYARYEPQVTQIELHPYLTQEPYLELAKTLGIAVTAYSSFGPQGWVELGMDKNATSLMQHDVVTQVAGKYGKSMCYNNPPLSLVNWS
jgi:D-xylose reductase